MGNQERLSEESVPCEFCGAEVGQACYAGGRERWEPHRTRQAAYHKAKLAAAPVSPSSLLEEMANTLRDARERLYGGDGSATEIGARITQLLARYKEEAKPAAVPDAEGAD